MARSDFKVFVSYSWDNGYLLDAITNGIEKKFSVWRDNISLKGGDDLAKAIGKALKEECEVMLLFISASSNASEWVAKEIEIGLQREAELGYAFIIPVLVDVKAPELRPLLGRVTLVLYAQTDSQVGLLIDEICNTLVEKEREIRELEIDRLKEQAKGFAQKVVSDRVQVTPMAGPAPPALASVDRADRQRALELARKCLLGPMAGFKSYYFTEKERKEYHRLLDARFKDRVDAYIRQRIVEQHSPADAKTLLDEIEHWAN